MLFYVSLLGSRSFQHCEECLPLLRKSMSQEQPATVINISGRKGSIELCPGTERVHGNYAYMCSKTAVNHLTRILSIEQSDILTVSMCPGWNRTDMGGPSV
ncbi:c-factor domain protein, partial [Ancylostoma duodenale]